MCHVSDVVRSSARRPHLTNGNETKRISDKAANDGHGGDLSHRAARLSLKKIRRVFFFVLHDEGIYLRRSMDDQDGGGGDGGGGGGSPMYSGVATSSSCGPSRYCTHGIW